MRRPRGQRRASLLRACRAVRLLARGSTSKGRSDPHHYCSRLSFILRATAFPSGGAAGSRGWGTWRGSQRCREDAKSFRPLLLSPGSPLGDWGCPLPSSLTEHRGRITYTENTDQVLCHVSVKEHRRAVRALLATPGGCPLLVLGQGPNSPPQNFVTRLARVSSLRGRPALPATPRPHKPAPHPRLPRSTALNPLSQHPPIRQAALVPPSSGACLSHPVSPTPAPASPCPVSGAGMNWRQGYLGQGPFAPIRGSSSRGSGAPGTADKQPCPF